MQHTMHLKPLQSVAADEALEAEAPLNEMNPSASSSGAVVLVAVAVLQ